MKPLAIDLCSGLGGWAHGLLAEGWEVIGYDIERHEYNGDRYPGQLIIQDIRTLNGEQFRGKASLIVASPPCTEFSYMAMPWSRGKQIAAALRGNGEFPEGYKGSRTIKELTELFDCCVRIGKEAGCPTIIENVRGAQPWVGPARWFFGSFGLWGDVPALDREVRRLCHAGQKTVGHIKRNGYDHTRHLTNQAEHGRKGVGSGPVWFDQNHCQLSSKSKARKAASAMIAKIPFPLAQWIARTYYPKHAPGQSQS